MSHDLGPRNDRGDDQASLRLRSPEGRWALAATVLGSAVVSLDSTAVNVATPAIGEDLDAGLTGLQWTINAYTLTLAGFLLLGGSLGDRFGRRRMFEVGVAWFAVASLLCAVAPTVEALVGARALQGVGGALLTPGSLAIIQASFHPEDRAAAIGSWSGLGGVAIAAGPLVGGWLVDAVSWRLIFLINLPVAAAVVLVARRHLPETRDPVARRLDPAGAGLTALGLAGVTYGLISGPESGWSRAAVGAVVVGVGAIAAFLVLEARSAYPMLPLADFRSRQFSATNLVTLVVYAALGGSTFLLAIQLQQVVGFTALEAGLAFLPLTGVMLVLSARSGRLAQRIGPRMPMTVGPILAAVGLGLMVRVDADATYLGAVLPAVLVLGAGLVLTVAPLTATVLAAAPDEHAGIASGVNNFIARVGALLAVAALPPLVGVSGDDYLDAAAFDAGFGPAILICAGLCAAGGVLSYLTIRRPASERPTGEPCVGCALDAPLPSVEASAR